MNKKGTCNNILNYWPPSLKSHRREKQELHYRLWVQLHYVTPIPSSMAEWEVTTYHVTYLR